jgi:hypothetical protein
MRCKTGPVLSWESRTCLPTFSRQRSCNSEASVEAASIALPIVSLNRESDGLPRQWSREGQRLAPGESREESNENQRNRFQGHIRVLRKTAPQKLLLGGVVGFFWAVACSRVRQKRTDAWSSLVQR